MLTNGVAKQVLFQSRAHGVVLRSRSCRADDRVARTFNSID